MTFWDFFSTYCYEKLRIQDKMNFHAADLINDKVLIFYINFSTANIVHIKKMLLCLLPTCRDFKE